MGGFIRVFFRGLYGVRGPASGRWSAADDRLGLASRPHWDDGVQEFLGSRKLVIHLNVSPGHTRPIGLHTMEATRCSINRNGRLTYPDAPGGAEILVYTAAAH
jgi:hypothetical protein